MPTAFAYDVAFSFLDADLDLVRQVEERLEGRFKTFVYADHQDKLAGTDGQASLRQVFEQDARTVVVMFRDGWGKSGMTGIEMLAMKDRAQRELFDWLLLIVLDEARPDPKFIPKTQIYWDYPKYGMDRLIGAIVNHVIRNDGEASPATVEGAMAAAKREQELAEARRRYLQGREAGEHLWAREGRRFQGLLLEKARATQAVALTCDGKPGNVASVSGPGAFLTTTLRSDTESWFMWCGFHTRNDRGETRSVEELTCRPDLDRDHEPAWKLKDRWLRSEHLADYLLLKLAGHMKPSA